MEIAVSGHLEVVFLFSFVLFLPKLNHRELYQ